MGGLDSLGYGRLVIKCEQGVAIKDVQGAVRQQRWGEFIKSANTVVRLRGLRRMCRQIVLMMVMMDGSTERQ